MPNKGLWVGIPLLALTLAAGAFVVQTNRHASPKDTSTGTTTLSADVMESAKKSCCAAQDASTKTTASETTQLTGVTSQPNDGKGIVESVHADKESCDHHASDEHGKCPVDKETTPTKLVKNEGVQQKAVCPVTGASPQKALSKTTVAEIKVASATK